MVVRQICTLRASVIIPEIPPNGNSGFVPPWFQIPLPVPPVDTPRIMEEELSYGG